MSAVVAALHRARLQAKVTPIRPDVKHCKHHGRYHRGDCAHCKDDQKLLQEFMATQASQDEEEQNNDN